MESELATKAISLSETWGKRPFIISGPCSAETREQVINTAIALANTGKVDLLRAGIWKPRTKPGMFEGVGKVGLTWLNEAKQATGLPTSVEVATAQHVHDAIESGVDVLWIGARTTVNPFSVQEVADALKDAEIPVFIKNPIHADIDLWTGGIERLQHAGVKKIGMIHRGFAAYGNTEYRNAPMWQLPIEMKRRFPEMKLICDPSHICGKRDTLSDVAQKSIDLDFDGLMLESHNDPDGAWSDALQQITPQALEQLLDNLIWRSCDNKAFAELSALVTLRESIDRVDDELLLLISQRMKISEKIGLYKKENNITILQAKRWSDMRERALQKGNKLSLSNEFIIRYFDAVHIESINHQTKVMNKD